jgi:hypothetical protein
MNTGNSDLGAATGETLQASSLANRQSNISASQSKLLRRLNAAGMSKPGEEWLISALDPYHDLALTLQGYPDGARQRSIVQVIKRDYDIRRPATLALDPGEQWDAHIFNMPNLLGESGLDATPPLGTASANANWASASGNNFLDDPGSVKACAPGTGPGNLNIVYVKSGSPAWIKGRTYPGTTGEIPPSSATCVIHNISPDYEVLRQGAADLNVMSSDYTSGLHRVIAQGYEISNTSKVLDMEGSITVYGQNSRTIDGIGARYVTALGSQDGPSYDVLRTSGPPATSDEALNLPGSRLWHSKYGAYVVPALQDTNIPYVSYEPKNYIWDGADQQALFYGAVPGDAGVIATLSTKRHTGPGTPPAGTPMMRSFDRCRAQHGVYITQQGVDAKFKLTCRWIIESASTVVRPGLVVLQPPSPELDPIARAVYSEAMRLAPPGVRLDENAFGEWFREAAGRVLAAVKPMARIAAPIAATAFTGNPMAGMVVNDLIHAVEGRRTAKPREEVVVMRPSKKKKTKVIIEEVKRKKQSRR